MSIFGDNRWNMNSLYSNVEYFFDNGGTLGEFYEVLEYYFEDKTIAEEER